MPKGIKVILGLQIVLLAVAFMKCPFDVCLCCLVSVAITWGAVGAILGMKTEGK